MEERPARVFLSYSRKDVERVVSIAARLEALGHDIWRDTDDLHGGEAWRRAIVRGIRASDVVLLLLSPESTASVNVRRELDIADDEHRPVLPAVLVGTQVPDEMRYNLAGIQLLDLTSLDPAKAAERISAAITSLVPVPAPRWAAPITTVSIDGAVETGLPVGADVPVDAGLPVETAPVADVPVDAAQVDVGFPVDAGVPVETDSVDRSVGSARRSGWKRRVAAVAGGLVLGCGVAAVIVAARTASSRGDGWTPSPLTSPVQIPCRGVGDNLRTPVKGQGATPGATVRATWRNVADGQQGVMDPTTSDSRGRFRIGFECLPSEIGQRWSTDATDGQHTFHWTVEGVAP